MQGHFGGRWSFSPSHKKYNRFRLKPVSQVFSMQPGKMNLSLLAAITLSFMIGSTAGQSCSSIFSRRDCWLSDCVWFRGCHEPSQCSAIGRRRRACQKSNPCEYINKQCYTRDEYTTPAPPTTSTTTTTYSLQQTSSISSLAKTNFYIKNKETK